MKTLSTDWDIGGFEGFNFREQSAIDRILTAEEVLNWNHDALGEAEFWPDGENFLAAELLERSECTASDIREVIRIFDELDEQEVIKAIYLRQMNRVPLSELNADLIADSSLYVFGKDYIHDLRRQAAYELFEMFWPEIYRQWEKTDIPGLVFDPLDFIEAFPTLELKTEDFKGFLIVDLT